MSRDYINTTMDQLCLSNEMRRHVVRTLAEEGEKPTIRLLSIIREEQENGGRGSVLVRVLKRQ